MSKLTNLCQKCMVNLCTLLTTKQTLGAPALNAIQVRFRKHRDAPIPQSKLFFIPTKPVQDPDEYEELKVLYREYRNDLESIRSFLTQRYVTNQEETRDSTDEAGTHSVTKLEEMLAAMKVENDRWNAEVAKEREERQFEKAIKNEERLQKYRAYEERRRLRLVGEAKQKVKTEMEFSKSYITNENLDDEIEKLLNSRINYEFAIDTQGTKITDSNQEKRAKSEITDL